MFPWNNSPTGKPQELPVPLSTIPPLNQESYTSTEQSDPHSRQSTTMRVITLFAVVLPFAGLIGAIATLWGWGMSWVELSLFCGMYLLTAVGITVGFHRLFTHRSFETNRVVKFTLGVLGSMAVQGPLLKWVACHRRHHQHSDRGEDPHSPHNNAYGVLGLVKGFYHAHVGWLFDGERFSAIRYARDIRQSKMLHFVSALFPVWVVVGLAVPTILGFFLIGGWKGALLGFIWGGLVRIFFVHHVTWSVNSVCHLWGSHPYECGDESKNNAFVGLISLGEGWHNNHHAYPTSARHGFYWYQIDISYWIIRAMALVGLAWNVRTPDNLAPSR